MTFFFYSCCDLTPVEQLSLIHSSTVRWEREPKVQNVENSLAEIKTV